MIWQLVKRDSAWVNAWLFTAACTIGCFFLSSNTIPMFGAVLGMAWIASQPQQRATLFQVALPIPSRDLFLARLISLFAAAWLPVAGCVAALMLASQPAATAISLIEIGGGLSVLVLVVLSVKVNEVTSSQWTPSVSLAIVWLLAVPVGLNVPPAIVLLSCAVICSVLFWRIWSLIPPSFEVLPGKPSGWDRPSFSVAGQLPRVSRPPGTPIRIWWTILRSLFQPRIWIFWPIIVLQFFGGQWFYVSIFAISPILGALARMSWARTLPLRRGALLTAIVFPWILPIVLNVLLSDIFIKPRPTIQFDQQRATSVLPPTEFWRVAPEGKAPLIQAPWHETWQPSTQRFASIAIYNPYGMGTDNTRKFFEWQYRRATLAVYGQAIEFRDRKRLTTLRPLTAQPRFALLNLSAAVCWVLLLVNGFLVAIHWRIQRLFGFGHKALGWMVGVPVFGILLADMLIPKFVNPISVTVLNALLFRISAALPDALPAVGLAALLPVVLLCYTAVALFDGAEPPPAATQAG